MHLHSAEMSTNGTIGERNLAQPSPRLVSAAHEFEGQMMKELLKPMTESDGLGSENSGGGVLAEFGAEALGKALSQRGGFGIANQIIARLSQSGNQSGTGSVTTVGHLNTGMRRLK